MRPAIEKPNTKDRQRWYAFRGAGLSFEEIAAREKIAVADVKKSLDRMEMYRFAVSSEEVDMEYNRIVLEMIPEQAAVLRQAMKAKKVATDKKGKPVDVADHHTRLRALDSIREFAAVTKPKQAGVSVNVQQNVANMPGQHTGSSGLSFEQKLREIRARRGEELPSERAMKLIEASTGMTQAEKIAQEFEDAGIDLEEGDLEALGGEDDGDEDSEED